MARTAKKKASAKVEKTTVKPVTIGEPEAPAAPEQDASALSIADLQAIAQVIDAAVRRGAFGASEVTEVGAIYTKLTDFLQVIADQQRAAEEAQKGGA
jgi:hypothetical protein